jgi:hypothetical protein
MLLDWVIAVGCIAACFVGGWLFVSSSLLQNYDDKETGVQVSRRLAGKQPNTLYQSCDMYSSCLCKLNKHRQQALSIMQGQPAPCSSSCS